ncbi:MAG: hypothetical protein WBO73_03830 [Gammaproteobacteria bacterium]
MGRALWWYLASLLVMSVGSILAARHYPGGYDWLYTVASALASQKHNPDGSIWFAGALTLSMILLWPYVSAINKLQVPPRSLSGKFAIGALRTGLICGAILGLERLLIHDLSAWVYKAHEILGLFTFAGLYCGIVGLAVLAMRRWKSYVLPLLLLVSPLLAIAITQFWLYLAQRDLGWVDAGWRARGIPIWFSFAFWQWLAIGFLWAGLGLLSVIAMNRGSGCSKPTNKTDR